MDATDSPRTARVAARRLPADGADRNAIGILALPPQDVCRRARIERDERFDGRFYFAVRTTGIFCRPVCPARTALERNVEYFASAPAAVAAGFRPCLRCRPEFEPKTMLPPDDLGRVLEQIEDGALDDEGSVAELADSLGLGERRLRRMFERELGTSPVRVAQMRRLLLARQLLENPDTPIIDIAFASGFASLRRFNEAFREAFDSTPSQFRGLVRNGGRNAAPTRGAGDSLVLRLGVRTPYDVGFLMRYLRARAVGGVERVVCSRADSVAGDGPDGDVGGESDLEIEDYVYERTFADTGAGGLLRVAFEATPRSNSRSELDDRAGAGATLRVGLTFTERSEHLPNLVDLVARVRRLFALGDDPSMLDVFAEDPVLGPLAARFPGTRFAGCFDPFEVGVRVILGQQVTVAGASTLATRLACSWGHALESVDARDASGSRSLETGPNDTGAGPEPHHLFPGPEDLVDAELETIGLPRTRAQTLREFARLLVREPELFQRAEDPERVRRSLLALPGVGEWTASLIAMRALRWRDGFPAGDLVLRRKYAAVSGSAVPTETALRSLAEAWRPERTLAAALLWRAN